MNTKRVAVLLADGFEEIEAITVVDVLRRAPLQVSMLGVTTRQPRGSHDIVVHADRMMAEAREHVDAVVLPGGMPGARHLRDSDDVKRFVVGHYQEGAIVAAICAAPIALARFGLLHGRRATCFPGFEGELGDAQFQPSDVVEDARIITSRAVGTALPFSLALVHRLCGADVATSLADKMLVRA